MSAVQKSAKNTKRPADSDEEESDIENPLEDYEDEDNEEEEDEANGEIKDDTEPEEEFDEYDYEVAAKVGAEQQETEPVDITILSDMENHEEDETLLVSKDALNIHTTPYLTKYEFTKVMALRAQQILTGAPPTVPASAFPGERYPIDPYTIALIELKMSRLPLIIGRRLPNNTIIRIPVHALLIPE